MSNQVEINKIKLTEEEIKQYSNILDKVMPDFVTLGAVRNQQFSLEKDIDRLEWMVSMIKSPEDEKAKALRALRLELHSSQQQLKFIKKLYWNVRKRHVLKMKKYKEVI